MRSRRSSVLIAVIVISSSEPGCCAGFNRRDRNLEAPYRAAWLTGVRPLLHRGDPGAGCWSPAEPGPAHRECGAARPGPERELRRLSSRAEHGTLVGPTHSPSVVALPPLSGTGRSSSTIRSSAAGERRSRHLPGPSPLQSLCQSEWSALAVRHAARAHSLGRLRLGAAVPDHPGAFRTLRTEAGPAAQEADRRQALLQTARWLPDRRIVAVADSSFSVIELLRSVSPHVDVVTRLRLDAGLYEPPPLPRPGARGRPRVKGARLPTLTERVADPATAWQRVVIQGWYGRTQHRLDVATGTALWHHPGRRVLIRWVLVRDAEGSKEPQAFLCTDLNAEPTEILGWFVRRWRVEVTLAEVRRHLGVERQWSDLAILRTTPALLGLFSLVTLWADRIKGEHGVLPDRVRWYPKAEPTFSDALALVRRELWTSPTFATSPDHRESAKNTDRLLNRLINVACNPP